LSTVSPEVLKRIPHRPPFLFIDEIVSESPEALVARRTWRADEDFYSGHYPGAPITPGVILCEAVFQAGALYLSKALAGNGEPSGVPLLVKIADVRFRNPVYPGDVVTIEVRKKDLLGGFYFLSGSMKRGETRVLSLEFSVAWKIPEAAP
jgi:3-hydroxyacyl-[acyl-carrier-protein] dehydratase